MANTGGSACACWLGKQLKALCKSRVSSLLPQTLALQSCCEINGRSGLEPHTHTVHHNHTHQKPSSAQLQQLFWASFAPNNMHLHIYIPDILPQDHYDSIFYHRTIMTLYSTTGPLWLYILPQDHYDSIFYHRTIMTLYSTTGPLWLDIFYHRTIMTRYILPQDHYDSIYSTTGPLWLDIFYHRTIMTRYILPQDHYDSPSTAFSCPLRLFCYPTATEFFLFCPSVLNNKWTNCSF